MPHSSGGGSHSGGSSGGGHFSGGGSHSGGSSSPSYTTRNAPFSGAHTYVRYYHGAPHYIYSTNPHLGESGLGKIRYFLLIFYIPFILAGFTLLSSSVQKPRRMTNTSAADIAIEDYADVFKDDSTLKSELQAFYDDTGIPVAIITADNDQWEEYYNIEYYAYDLYVNRYTDEKHWLIVYTTDHNTDFEKWYFHGMQGDDTDNILTADRTAIFNDELTKYLTARSKYSVEQSFCMAFKDLRNGIMELRIIFPTLIFGIVWCGFVCLHMYMMLFAGTGWKYRGYTRVRSNEYIENQKREHGDAIGFCEYCNSAYRIGDVLECPNCGAPLKQTT